MPVAEAEAVTHRAQACLADTGDDRSRPTDWTRLDAELAEARTAIEGALSDGKASANRPLELCSLLTRIDELQQAIADREGADQLAGLRRIRNAVDELRELDPDGVMAAAPRELCTYLDFGRAMLSSVERSTWLPNTLHFDPELGSETTSLLSYIETARIPLSHEMLETDLVRRRIPAVVPSVRDEARVFREIVDTARVHAYIAAPITARGRAIGLLHVDRPRDGRELAHRDRDRVVTFASCFALIYEQAVLRQQLTSQRERAHASFRRTEELLARIERADLELRDAHQRIPTSPPTRAEQGDAASSSTRVDALLTVREREVLGLMSTGATNMQIAKRLVISEGTVKCHVGHILHKLRAPSRAAAIARYARISQRRQAA